MKSSLHKILVVGGGAGGLELASHLGRTLGRKRLARPILLDCNITHIWKPLLHEVATGALNTGEDEVNYFAHAHNNDYKFYLGGMSGLDRNRRIVNVDPVVDSTNGDVIIKGREVPYDTLVLAVGSVTNDFGTPGVREFCKCLNTPDEANALRRKILLRTLMTGLGGPKGPGKVRIGIVGGGATGVELAAEIHHTVGEMRSHGAKISVDQLDITIMEGAPRILGAGPEALSTFAANELKKRNVEIRLNCGVKAVTADGFVLKDGSILRSDIKIWTAGVKAPDWLGTLGLTVNRINQIQVDGNLQSVEDPNIFAMGDCAFAPDGKSKRFLPATAQVASQQAKWLAEVLGRRLKNKSYKPFKYQSKGMLVSLGSSAAVGSLTVGPKENYHVEGVGAKKLYASLYRMHQGILFGWTRTGFLWLGDELRHVAMPKLKFH